MKSICSIISLVSSGRLVKNRIWLGGASITGPPMVPAAGMVMGRDGGAMAGTLPSTTPFFFFFLASPGPPPSRFGLSWKVPFSLAMTSESDLK